MERLSFGNAVEFDIATERLDGGGAGLKSVAPRVRGSRREHSVGAHIGSHVEKDVVFSEVMKEKAHLRKVVQPAIYVLCSAVHSTRDQESGTVGKGDSYRGFREQASRDLPSNEPANA